MVEASGFNKTFRIGGVTVGALGLRDEEFPEVRVGS
jgi:hypothetical protein